MTFLVLGDEMGANNRLVLADFGFPERQTAPLSQRPLTNVQRQTFYQITENLEGLFAECYNNLLLVSFYQRLDGGFFKRHVHSVISKNSGVI